jgi:hypothetical protein
MHRPSELSEKAIGSRVFRAGGMSPKAHWTSLSLRTHGKPGRELEEIWLLDSWYLISDNTSAGVIRLFVFT